MRDSTLARSRRLPAWLCSLFPGYKLESIRLPEHVDLVMLHRVTRGGGAERLWLVRRFGHDGVRRWIHEHRGRGLTVRQMAPWIPERTARRWQQQNPYAVLWEER